MLQLSYLGESKKLQLSPETEKWLIVRKPISGIPHGFLHVPALSPSIRLFDKAQEWKQGYRSPEDLLFLESQQIENSADAWWDLYAHGFQEEIKNRTDMKEMLKHLERRMQAGLSTVIFCFCKKEERCHRTFIGSYFEQKGYPVSRQKKEEEQPKEFEQLSIFDY